MILERRDLMSVLISKFISIFMAFIISIGQLFGITVSVFPNEPTPENYKVYYEGQLEIDNKEHEWTIISDFETWDDTVITTDDMSRSEVKNLYGGYKEDFFSEKSLAIIPITIPHDGYGYFIEHSETDNTLNFFYELDQCGPHESEEEYQITVAVAVSKNITDVNIEYYVSGELTQKDYALCSSSGFSFSEPKLIISDYETFQSVKTAEDEILSEYNEEYFESRSLALVKFSLKNNEEISYMRVSQEGNVLDFNYETEVTNDISEQETIEMILVAETRKNTDVVLLNNMPV